jgi:Tfp pilus assembly protein PilV
MNMPTAGQQFKNAPARRSRRAFSLVEIIVILFIISLGLMAILSLIIQNIQSQSYNRNNLTAYQLAQEGIEMIRKVRDSNWKVSAAFTLGLATTTGTTYQNYMDYRDTWPHDASANPTLLTILKQDSAGLYFHDSVSPATTSPFSRLIRTKKLDNNSLQVNSVVSWQDHNRNYSYDLETILYNWY